MGLGVYLFSRLENWFDAFALRIGEPLATNAATLLSQRDIVLVPQLSHAAVLEMHLARHHGVCAGVEFDLPGRFLWKLTTDSFQDIQGQAPFQSERLRWTIFSILGGDFSQAAGPDEPLPESLARRVAALKSFADGRDTSQLPLFDLACRLATVFEGYVINRKDWLTCWQAGASVIEAAGGQDLRAQGLRHRERFQAHEPWQAWLWRQILRRQGELAQEHPFVRFERQIAVVAAKAHEQGIARITLMGMPALTLHQMRLYAVLARHIEVRWLAMNPCKSYWDDLPELARHQPDAFLPDTPWLNEQGPALLGLWGKGQRDYLGMLRALETMPSLSVNLADIDVAAASTVPGVLNDLQLAIETRLPFPASEDAAAEQAAELQHDDAAIQVHACQTLSHQLLVLRECLLKRFNNIQAPVRPGECLVLCADLEAARPAIEQVFGAPSGNAPDGGHIAYRVARSERPQTALSMLLLEVLGFQARQFSLDQLAQWLTQPLFLSLVRLDADQAARVVNALSELGFVSNLGARHGFEASLERLLLGAAMDMPVDRDEIGVEVLGRRAMARMSLQEVSTLEPLLSFMSGMEQLSRGEHAFTDWIGRIDEWLVQWIEPVQHLHADGSLQDDLLSLRSGLQQAVRSFPAAPESADEAAAATGHSPVAAGAEILVDAAVVRRCLTEAMTTQAGQGQLGGALNFVQLGGGLIPPTAIVAVIGMDQTLWPRQVAQDELDLSQAWTRQGDLSGYFQDRAHVLDALMAARHGFWMFYQGIEPANGNALGPSSQVSELLANLGLKPRRHTLAVPFGASRPVRLGAAASKSMLGTYLTLNAREHSITTVRPLRLRELLDALLDPSRALLRHWSVALQRDQVLAAQEPLDVTMLDDDGRFSQGRLALALARRRLLSGGGISASSESEGPWHDTLADHPVLADGPGSARMAQRIHANAQQLLDNVSARLSENPGQVRMQGLRLRVEGYDIQDSLPMVHGDGMPATHLALARSAVTINGLLHAWLCHCLCNAVLGPIVTCLVPIKGGMTFAAFDSPDQALETLRDWIRFYEEGLADPQLFAAENWARRELLEGKKGNKGRGAPAADADDHDDAEEANGEAAELVALSDSASLIWKEARPDSRALQERASQLLDAIKQSLAHD